MTSQLNIFGEKTIIILLVATILTTSFCALAVMYNNDETSKQTVDENHKFVAAQANQTREVVEVHANQTAEALGILKKSQVDQQPILEKFESHINQTATAAPVVLQNQQTLNQILEKENQIVIELQRINNSNNSTGIAGAQ